MTSAATVLTLLAVTLTAQPAPDEPTYVLRYAPEAGRTAHYQGIFHGTAWVSKLPGIWELNGRMHLKEEVPDVSEELGALQRLTFVDASFRFSGLTVPYHGQGTALTVRRGADGVCTELVSRPPAASVESGDVLGVIASMPWSLVFPKRQAPVRVGETWARRFAPAPPDIGPPVGPETHRPRKLIVENTLRRVDRVDGRDLAVIAFDMLIRETLDPTNTVTLRGEAAYWLDNGEMLWFDADFSIQVTVNVSDHIVKLEIRDAWMYWEERDAEDVTLGLPLRGPTHVRLEAKDVEPLALGSFPIEPEWLAPYGLTPPPESKPYVLELPRTAAASGDDPAGEDDAAARRSPRATRQGPAGHVFYAYRSTANMAVLREWAAATPGATVEDLPASPVCRVRLPGARVPDVLIFHHPATDRRYVVVTDDPALAERAIALSGPPEPDPEDSPPRSPEGSQGEIPPPPTTRHTDG